MKRFILFLFVCLGFISGNGQNIKDADYYRNKGYQVFEKFGFAINAVVRLEDISQMANGDFALNYAGIEAPNSNQQCFYQIMITSLPIGYKNYSQKEIEEMAMKVITEKTKFLKNTKKIYFSENGYSGVCGDCTHNGMKQKGVFFYRDGYIYAMTVIGNYNLEAKYNAFTNAIKFFDKKTSSNISTNTNKTNEEKTYIREIGCSVLAPIVLEKKCDANYDYYYIGVVDKHNENTGIVYKISINRLPMKLSQMSGYNRETIKSNIKNYAYSKSNCTTFKPNIDNVMAYSTFNKEFGFNVRECVILTDEYTITLSVASKKDISSHYTKFINSLSK